MSYTPEQIFNPEWNYTAEEIADIAGIDRDVIDRAAEAREIASVCVIARGGHKGWKGDKIASWIRRMNLDVAPSELIKRTIRPE